MIVEQIWTNNQFRNFNYLIACPETGDALAIDPLDHVKCLSIAKDKGWEITQILNTHEHGDHTGGNGQMIKATGAKLLAHEKADYKIAGIDKGLTAGDIIKVGRTIELECLDTPGHTMSHICLLSRTDEASLFCGDTLFNAGAGNCHNGGHPDELYLTFTSQLAKLPDDTKIYPGHDYMVNNLRFTLSREPKNEQAKLLLKDADQQDPNLAMVTTIGQEKQINTFFRLDNPEIIEELRKELPDIPISPDPKSVFLALRKIRNSW